jgi:hypothetical protein
MKLNHFTEEIVNFEKSSNKVQGKEGSSIGVGIICFKDA